MVDRMVDRLVDRPLTLLHTADLHLGMAFPGLGERGREHREQLRRTFARIVEVALERRVDLLVVAGDLFHSPRQGEGTIAFVRDQFRRLGEGGVRVALVAGNHDPLVEESVWTRGRFQEAPHVHLFGPAPEAVTYPDLDLTVVGQSVGPDGAAGLAAWPRRPTTTRFAVGVAHGSAYREGMVEDGPIHPADIRALGLDYLALGDWHSPSQVSGPPTPAWYAGAPEFLAMDQDGGQVLLVTIPAPGAATVEAVPVGRRRYRRRQVDVTGLDPAQVQTDLLAEADPDTVLDVVLIGLAPPGAGPDPRALEDALQEVCFRARVRDARRPLLDEATLEAFPERTLVGRFIREMRRRADAAPQEEREVLEEALQLGVALLLHPEDV